MTEHYDHTRPDLERRKFPPHTECNMFTTEESRVAVRQFMELITPENLQLAKTWFDRLKEAEKSEWRTKIRILKLAALAGGFIIVYSFLIDVKFISWFKGVIKP